MRISLTLLILISQFGLFAQTDAYDLAMEKLSTSEFLESIDHFKEASKSGEKRLDALTMLIMLEHDLGMTEDAQEHFKEYLVLSPDPQPLAYALFFTAGVSGPSGQQNAAQLNNLKKLTQLSPNHLEKSALYNIGASYQASFDKKRTMEYFQKIPSVLEYSLLGPFDNTMNCSYDKDFGVLADAKMEGEYSSKYGADISWYSPKKHPYDPYFFPSRFFNGGSSQFYLQSFVNFTEAQDVVLNLGYTGELKLWLNDQLVHMDPNYRTSELDDYKYTVHVNAGANRLLVQLGDFDTRIASLIVRFSNANGQDVLYTQSQSYSPYTPGTGEVKAIPHFAIDALSKKVEAEPENFVNMLLLSEAYKRMAQYDLAEQCLLDAQKLAPDNYSVLRAFIKLYSDQGNSVKQSLFYDDYSKRFPLDHDILVNEISDAVDDKDIPLVREKMELYKDNYDDDFQNMQYQINLAFLEEDYEMGLRLIDKFYADYPKSFEALKLKYEVGKAMSESPKQTDGYLERYLENTYDYGAIATLAADRFERGDYKQGKALLLKNIEFIDYDRQSVIDLANEMVKQKDYRGAEELLLELLDLRPTDSGLWSDLASVYNFKGDKQNAIKYYNESLRYFPFPFITHEKLRELKDETPLLDMVEEIEPEDYIKRYEEEYEKERKNSYEVVMERNVMAAYNSPSVAYRTDYIIKIMDEDGIADWQNISFDRSSMSFDLREAYIIKPSGGQVEGERHYGSEVVFANIEVGDYIYVSYDRKQRSGGKTSFFVNDRLAFNSYTPTFSKEYILIAEEGMDIDYVFQHSDLEPTIEEKDGFVFHTWQTTNLKSLPDESNPIAFNDLAQILHVAVHSEWTDVVDWYQDLSSVRAEQDKTVKDIAAEIKEKYNPTTELETARAIYDFIGENVKYSFIDFRQSNYVPQKAADVYHTKLGDCKDISTLFAAVSREMGLSTNLLLVLSSDFGQNANPLPSLNFNHCMVATQLDGQEYILELTDHLLPFGFLDTHHEGARYLKIPFGDDEKVPAELQTMKANPGFVNGTVVESTLVVDQAMSFEVSRVKKCYGTYGTSISSYYSNMDEETQVKTIQSSIAEEYSSLVKLHDLEFVSNAPREDTLVYKYSYSVEDDITRAGDFKTLKIPFSGKLVTSGPFQDAERVNDFDFLNYESYGKYEEFMTISLPPGSALLETPKNVDISYGEGFSYQLHFKSKKPNQLEVHRVYKNERRNISQSEYSEFRDFMLKMVKAEDMTLIFK